MIVEFVHVLDLEEPINVAEEIICNCSFSGCGAEITRFLGSNYTGLCRSTSGICYKRLLPDRSVVLRLALFFHFGRNLIFPTQ